MIVNGAQIRAARALAGMRRIDLARAARLHQNAVAYWERHEKIPSGHYSEPWAVARIRQVFEVQGIATFADPSPGVRMLPGFAPSAKPPSRPRAAFTPTVPSPSDQPGNREPAT